MGKLGQPIIYVHIPYWGYSYAKQIEWCYETPLLGLQIMFI